MKTFMITFTEQEGQALGELIMAGSAQLGPKGVHNASFWFRKLESANEIPTDEPEVAENGKPSPERIGNS